MVVDGDTNPDTHTAMWHWDTPTEREPLTFRCPANEWAPYLSSLGVGSLFRLLLS